MAPVIFGLVATAASTIGMPTKAWILVPQILLETHLHFRRVGERELYNEKLFFKSFLPAVLLISSLLIMPSTRFGVCQDGATEEARFEVFGPRADRLLVKLYADESEEWTALAKGEIDIADWTLTKEYYDNFTSTAINPFTGQPYNETIETVSYGAEFGIFLLDFNNNNNEFLDYPPNPAYPNPVYPNPCGVKEFRQALSHLVNRSTLDVIIGEGLYAPLYTIVPPSMGGYSHPDIKPGGVLEDLTYPYSRSAAEALLDVNGFPLNSSTGWRFWDRNKNDVEDEDEHLELKFVIRTDHGHRRDVSEVLASELEAVKVRVNRVYRSSGGAFAQVMLDKDFHLFIGGYPVGEDPDYFYPLFYSGYYWHPGFCYNYNGIMEPEYDFIICAVVHASSENESILMVHLAQEDFARNAFKAPLWCYAGSKGVNRFYTGGNMWQAVDPDDGENTYRGRQWEGVVNRLGYGIDNFWSFMTMHPQGYRRGDGENMTIRWGLKTTKIKMLNPVYADWRWDWNLLNLIYEKLIVRNPQNRADFIPWLVEAYGVDTYIHPTLGECTKMKLTLRPDVFWSDGTPLTVADVYFSFIELKQILESRGLPNPWWYSNVQDIIDFKILDPYNFEILFTYQTVWVLGWISDAPILPKHIWKPIAETGPVQDFAPDPNMIGSGPWRFKEYTENSHVLLIANNINCTVQTDLPESTRITSSRGYFRYHPVTAEATVNRSTASKVDLYDQPYTINYTIHNLYDESLTVSVNLTHPNGTIYTETGVVIPARDNWTHSWTGTLGYLMTTRIAIDITSPTEFEGVYSWSRIYYGTMITFVWNPWDPRISYGSGPDIVGSTFYDDIGLSTYPYKAQIPTPDFKVDIRDIAFVAKGFGCFPGHGRWVPFADVNNDYKIDIKDIAEYCMAFGWVG